MQFKNVFRFKIFYINEEGNKDYFYIYSEKEDVYSLEDLPDTTFYIERFYCTHKEESRSFGSYLVGTPLSIDELKKEIKNTDISARSYLHDLSSAYRRITELGSNYHILRKQGKLICLDKLYFPGENVGEINDGKIVMQGAQTKQPAQIKQPVKSIKSKYDNDNYIDLE